MSVYFEVKSAQPLSASTLSMPDPWGSLGLGAMAKGSPTTILASVPLGNSYGEYSQTWVQAAKESMTPVDIKNLVDSLGNWVGGELAVLREEWKAEAKRLCEALLKRKNESKGLKTQVDNLEATRQGLVAQVAELQAQNQVLHMELATAKVAYNELKARVQAGTSSSSMGLSQSLFPTMKEPDTFNGEKGEGKLDDWLESMALWLHHHGVTNEERKVKTAMIYL